MKKLILSITVLFAITLLTPVRAQKTDRQLEKELSSKAMKKARKEAKKLKKDGFFVPPGALPMDIQIENAWNKQPVSPRPLLLQKTSLLRNWVG